MKKILAFLLAMTFLFTLTACGEKQKNKNLGGTWKVDCVEYEGTKFSVEEWNNLEDEDLSGFYIILKDGGKAYVYDDGYGDLVDWLQSDDNIMIDGEKCSIIDGKICLDYYGDKLYLKKTSDNQEIPKEESSDEEDFDDEEDSFDDTDSSETEEDSVDDAEWKQFLAEYEEWVDEYIALVKKYKENPTDMTILSDYTEMLAEMADWTEEADDIGDSIDDAEDAAEYSAEIIRIAAKIAKAAEEL